MVMDIFASLRCNYASMVMDLEQRLRLWAVGGMGVRECKATTASLNASTSMVMDCAWLRKGFELLGLDFCATVARLDIS